MPVSRRQPPSTWSSGSATASRSASGSLAMTSSAPRGPRRLEGQVHRAGLFRVREGDGRERAVGLDLLVDDDRRRVARAPRRSATASPSRRRASPCRSSAGPRRPAARTPPLRSRRRRRRRRTRGAVTNPSDRGSRDDIAVVGDALDVRGDLAVGGRHDLGAVVVAAEVDLVAVVVGRVVAGGDHHARRRRRGGAPRRRARASAAAAAAGSARTPAPAKSSAESCAKTRELRRPS